MPIVARPQQTDMLLVRVATSWGALQAAVAESQVTHRRAAFGLDGFGCPDVRGACRVRDAVLMITKSS